MIYIREKKEVLNEGLEEGFRELLLTALPKKVKNTTVYYLIGNDRASDKAEIKFHYNGMGILLNLSGHKIIKSIVIDVHSIVSYEEDGTKAASFSYESVGVENGSLIFRESRRSNQYLSIKI